MNDLPYIYEIEPTNHCPYKCIMCPRGLGRMTRTVGFMDIETVQMVLEQFPAGQKIVRLHHFGEAILHPQIDVIIRLVREKNLLPVISLNPATLTESLSRKIIDAQVGLVCFSFDSFSNQGLREIRGIHRSVDDCFNEVEIFIEMSRAAKSRPIQKIIQMVKLSGNEGDRDKFWELKQRYPEDDVGLYLTENYGFGDVDLIEKTLPGGSQAVLMNAPACGAPFSEVSVLWNGDVVLCCYDYDGVNVIGNIKQETLADIWHGDKVKKMRELFACRATQGMVLCGKCFQAPHRFGQEESLLSKGWEEETTILKLINSDTVDSQLS